MSQVPRGTSEPVVRPLLFRKDMREALAAGEKRATRRLLTASNTLVNPGTFEGLRMDTGRVRGTLALEFTNGSNKARLRSLGVKYLRAQCEMPNGRVRVVSALPLVQPGDAYWVKENRYTSRAKSQQTIQVTGIGISRVNDLTNEQALAEGVEHLPPRVRRKGSPRDWFAWLWNDIHGGDAWVRNDWVWVYGLNTYIQNVDQWLQTTE